MLSHKESYLNEDLSKAKINVFEALVKYKTVFEKIFNPDFEGEPEMYSEDCDCGRLNTSLANYVWLPFRFDGEMAYLDWKNEWRIEDYE